MEELRYPNGPYNTVQYLDEKELRICIQRIESFPETLKNFVASFDTADWQATYRPGGWSAVQLVHHLADSHLHSYARLKHSVTEETPTIKDYPESLWAELEDAQSIEHIPASLQMITGIHQRWGAFLKKLKPKDYNRSFYHPETQTHHSLYQALAYYSWHCDHHLGHLKIIKNKA